MTKDRISTTVPLGEGLVLCLGTQTAHNWNFASEGRHPYYVWLRFRLGPDETRGRLWLPPCANGANANATQIICAHERTLGLVQASALR